MTPEAELDGGPSFLAYCRLRDLIADELASLPAQITEDEVMQRRIAGHLTVLASTVAERSIDVALDHAQSLAPLVRDEVTRTLSSIVIALLASLDRSAADIDDPRIADAFTTALAEARLQAAADLSTLTGVPVGPIN
ncbi:hypothetical protein LMIY3S_02725 [Labrys miyagiensis]